GPPTTISPLELHKVRRFHAGRPASSTNGWSLAVRQRPAIVCTAPLLSQGADLLCAGLRGAGGMVCVRPGCWIGYTAGESGVRPGEAAAARRVHGPPEGT